MKLRILLADDHQILREGLRSLLEQEPDMEVVAEAEDGRQAIEMVRKVVPDVIVIDVGMPGLNGIDATRQIKAENDSMRVVALSMHADGRFVQQMTDAGASAYLLKDCAAEELAQAIREVIGGGLYFSAGIDVPVHLGGDTGTSRGGELSLREREVLQLLAEGNTTKQIALALHLSPKTIETHRQRIMAKLNLHSLAELTKYAIREGLTSLDK